MQSSLVTDAVTKERETKMIDQIANDILWFIIIVSVARVLGTILEAAIEKLLWWLRKRD